MLFWKFVDLTLLFRIITGRNIIFVNSYRHLDKLANAWTILVLYVYLDILISGTVAKTSSAHFTNSFSIFFKNKFMC